MGNIICLVSGNITCQARSYIKKTSDDGASDRKASEVMEAGGTSAEGDKQIQGTSLILEALPFSKDVFISDLHPAFGIPTQCPCIELDLF